MSSKSPIYLVASEFKKGDVVYLVGACMLNDTVALVEGVRVTLTSMGKKQGTGVRVVDGRNVLHRIYADRQLVSVSPDEIHAYAAKVGPPLCASRIVGILRCVEESYPNLRPEYRAAGATRIAELKATTPSYEVRIIE